MKTLINQALIASFLIAFMIFAPVLSLPAQALVIGYTSGGVISSAGTTAPSTTSGGVISSPSVTAPNATASGVVSSTGITVPGTTTGGVISSTVPNATVPGNTSNGVISSTGVTVPGTTSGGVISSTVPVVTLPGTTANGVISSTGVTVPGTTTGGVISSGVPAVTVPGTTAGGTVSSTGTTIPGTTAGGVISSGTSNVTVPGTTAGGVISAGTTPAITVPGTTTTGGVISADTTPVTPPVIVPPAPGHGSSGGGGGSVISFAATPCYSVVYGEWNGAVNGYQYRDVISQTPAGCVLTAPQQEARSRRSGSVPPQILGVKYYPDGSLLRSPDWKIYIIVNGRKQFIKNWGILCEKYKGQPIINVSYEVLAQYPEVLGIKVYANGTLLRGSDKKIYLITNGRKQRVKTLKELAKYRGKKITDVSNEILAQIPEVLGAKAYANGSLLRGTDKKVYVIVDGQRQLIKSPKELLNYKGKKINNVSSEILSQYPEVLCEKNCGKESLVRGPDKRVYLIVNGKRKQIRNLQELISFRGREIVNIDSKTLASYPEI